MGRRFNCCLNPISPAGNTGSGRVYIRPMKTFLAWPECQLYSGHRIDTALGVFGTVTTDSGVLIPLIDNLDHVPHQAAWHGDSCEVAHLECKNY
eukprot:1395131-Amorphochlora_amoeboformis.AAC.2